MPVQNSNNYKTILGIRFFTGPSEQAVQIGLAGGLVVVPAAPALAELDRDEAYRNALLNADLVITDSGLMVLLWRLLRRERIIRTSGLEYIRNVLNHLASGPTEKVAWIMPTPSARDRNLQWLKSAGFSYDEDDCYLAPMYPPRGELTDPALLAWIRQRNPRHIVVALGGGTQERLGEFLRRELPQRPSIYCIGAAIGFLSGDQVKIPAWADYLYLGWLFRCFSEPKRFVPRYWRARRLCSMMWRYGERLPPLAAGA